MPKRPESMTPDERLTRIRSLERKVSQLTQELVWAERERVGTLKWGQSAFAENRRLTDRLQELIARIPSIIEPDMPRSPALLPSDIYQVGGERDRSGGNSDQTEGDR